MEVRSPGNREQRELDVQGPCGRKWWYSKRKLMIQTQEEIEIRWETMTFQDLWAKFLTSLFLSRAMGRTQSD